MSTPLYLIACHSAVCISYASCKTPGRKGTPIFRIPPSTYILNFTSGGEYCMFGTAAAKMVQLHKNEFRKFLLLDDRDDVFRGEAPKEYSFVSSVMRATQADYPNIGCTFKEKPGIPNELGVFNLDTTTHIANEHSLISATQLGPYKDDVWYLDDIINYVYSTQKQNKGIFLFAGCTSGFKQAKLPKNLNGPASKAIEYAHNLIRIAELEYGTTAPVIDRETIEREEPDLLAKNFGIKLPTAQEDPTLMAHIARGFVENVDDIANLLPYHNAEDGETARKLLMAAGHKVSANSRKDVER
jgi:hypothetical protein